MFTEENRRYFKERSEERKKVWNEYINQLKNKIKKNEEFSTELTKDEKQKKKKDKD